MTATFEDRLDRAVTIFLSILLVYFVSQALKVQFDLITAPGPLDPRENQLWMFTDLLARGENPYSAKFLPAFVNVYGIAEPLAALPFAKLFGESLMLERVLSAVCLYGSAALIASYVRKCGLSWLAGLSIAGAMLIILINSLAVTGKVDAFGVLMGIAAFVVPHRFAFRLWPLLFSAAFGVAALFTKVYFIYGFLIAVGYAFLFVSIARALIATAVFAGLTIVALFTLNWAAPFYLNLTFGIAASIGSDPRSMSSIRSAFRLYYIVLNTWPLWAFAVASIAAFALGTRKPVVKQVNDFVRRMTKSLRLTNWSRGVFAMTFNYAAFAFVVAGIVSFYLQMHSSGGRNYYFQVLVPVALPFLAVVIASCNPLSGRWGRHAVALASFATLLIVFLTADTPHRNFTPFPRGQDAQQWLPLERALDGAKDVLHTPEVAHLIHARKLPVYNTGSADFFLTNDEIRTGVVAPAKKKIWDDFIAGIARKVEDKRFNAIFTWKDQDNFVSRAQIEKSYRLETTVKLELGFYALAVEVWRPK